MEMVIVKSMLADHVGGKKEKKKEKKGGIWATLVYS